MEVLRSKIKLPDRMMRQTVSERDMEDLVRSIKEIGIINPIIVRKLGDEYELVAGLRRLMAADMLKMEKVYVRVIRAGDERSERIKVDENKAREDIGPLDEGVYFADIMEKFGWNQKQLAEKLRVSESYVSQRIGSGNWPEILKEVVQNGKLTFSVAREFAGIKDSGELDRIIEQAVRSGVTPAVAARWRHEANREYLRSEGEEDEDYAYATTRACVEAGYVCQVCGGPGQEIGYQILRICNICMGVIKVGQEKGVFQQEEEEKGATGGEAVE